jgi:hypothetical protein
MYVLVDLARIMYMPATYTHRADSLMGMIKMAAQPPEVAADLPCLGLAVPSSRSVMHGI